MKYVDMVGSLCFFVLCFIYPVFLFDNDTWGKHTPDPHSSKGGSVTPTNITPDAESVQRFMDEILRGLDFAFTYIDDVVASCQWKNTLTSRAGNVSRI